MYSKDKMRITTPDGVMEIRIEDITPEYAEELLELNTSNRAIKPNRVSLYASEMSARRWKSNGVPIVIGNDGILKDGQHRLLAISKSKVTMENAIIVFAPEENTNNYDIGAARNVSDIAILDGKTDYNFRSKPVIAAMTLSMKISEKKTGKVFSKTKVIENIERYHDACTYVRKSLINKDTEGRRFIKIAAVASPILNAYINEYPVDKLDRFIHVLTYGIVEAAEELTIIKLRDYLMQNAVRGNMDKMSIYYRVQNALHSFAIGRVVTRCVESSVEYYKFPG